MRGPRQHFTHSKVMAWVAFDRAVHDAEEFGLEGPVDRWRVCATDPPRRLRAGLRPRAESFVQAYGSRQLDASLLLLPIVGFLPPEIRGCAARWRRSSAT